jgi:hypothetical protein
MNENGSKKAGSYRDVIIAQKTMFLQRGMFYRLFSGVCKVARNRNRFSDFGCCPMKTAKTVRVPHSRRLTP